ncbi:hypothetical protein OG788_39085 [Streptomyces sp. NBC_00647]|uniref:hypothetical protein n=1 Tax=Streptomyces sp. NBC_00647 TaxID=2975796 RepID=UPI00325567B2
MDTVEDQQITDAMSDRLLERGEPPRDNLTRDERQRLWKYKQRIVAGEMQDRRATREQDSWPNRPTRSGAEQNKAPQFPLVWVRPPELDRIQEQRQAAAARTRAAAEKKRQERATMDRIEPVVDMLLGRCVSGRL